MVDSSQNQIGESAGTYVPGGDDVECQLDERKAHTGEIASLLLDNAVFPGEAKKRWSLAAELARDGMTAEVFELLAEQAIGSFPSEERFRGVAVLAWRLKHPDRWNALAEDLGIFERARERKHLKQNRSPLDFLKPASELRAKLGITDAEYQQRFAWYRMKFDNLTAEQVAEEMNTTEDQARQWFAEENAVESRIGESHVSPS